MTSYLFPDAKFSTKHLNAVLHVLNQDRSKLVIDLSCRRQGAKWFVAMNKWQTLTDMELDESKSLSLAIILPCILTESGRVHKATRAFLLRVLDTCC